MVWDLGFYGKLKLLYSLVQTHSLLFKKKISLKEFFHYAKGYAITREQSG